MSIRGLLGGGVCLGMLAIRVHKRIFKKQPGVTLRFQSPMNSRARHVERTEERIWNFRVSFLILLFFSN